MATCVLGEWRLSLPTKIRPGNQTGQGPEARSLRCPTGQDQRVMILRRQHPLEHQQWQQREQQSQRHQHHQHHQHNQPPSP